jgi:two-component system CheB/CheR fusion protein
MRMLPYRTVDNVIGGVVITFVDITRITAAESRIEELTHSLRDRIQSLETLLDLLPVGIMIVEDNRSDLVRINRYGAELLGVPKHEGIEPRTVPPLRLLQGEHELAAAEQPLQRAARSGEVVPGFEGQIVRADGSRADLLMMATPLVDGGRLRGGVAALIDISERKRSESHQQVLLFELQHRVKNILATISALASRILRGTSSLEEFSRAFLGRLRAMAMTHELLSHTNWEGTDLRQLLDMVVRGQTQAQDAIVIEGPELRLAPGAAATLGMAFYELATNATKYGALTAPRGRVEIAWQVAGGPAGSVALTWTELDGPTPPASISEAFGVGFVRRSVEYEMQGTAVMEPTAQGVRWNLQFPVEGNVQNA